MKPVPLRPPPPGWLCRRSPGGGEGCFLPSSRNSSKDLGSRVLDHHRDLNGSPSRDRPGKQPPQIAAIAAEIVVAGDAAGAASEAARHRGVGAGGVPGGCIGSTGRASSPAPSRTSCWRSCRLGDHRRLGTSDLGELLKRWPAWPN